MSSAEPPPSAPVPIFPLPSVQLFPHALMPLHVFEPRYRELVRDCLAATGDHLIALPSLEPGHEAALDGRPPVRIVCGLGRVIAHDVLPDGRSNVLLRGIGRVRIVEELPAGRSYRLVRLEPVVEVYRAGFDGPGALGTLLVLADQLALRLPSGGDTLRSLVRSHGEPGARADVLAAALVTDPADRQLLLETADVATRIDLVCSQMSTILARFADHTGPAN